MKLMNTTVRNVAAIAIALALFGGQTTFAANAPSRQKQASAQKKKMKKRVARTLPKTQKKSNKEVREIEVMAQAKPKLESDFVDSAGIPIEATPQRPQSKSAGAQSTLATKVEAPKSKRIGLTEAKWRMGVYTDSFANEKEQAQQTSFRLRGAGKYGLLKGVSLQADLQVGLNSGYVQTTFGDPDYGKGGFSFKQAVVEIKPIEAITVLGGAINQAAFGHSQIVDFVAFPGALEKVEVGPEVFKVTLQAQQLIPTSSTTDTNAAEAEVSPAFINETLKIESKLSEVIAIDAHASHFQFSGLPSKIADGSKPFGNTIAENTELKKPMFKYGFSGYVAGAGTTLTFTPKFSWNLSAKVLQNMEAPGEIGAGQYATTGFTLGLPNAIDLVPSVELFSQGSDLSPAAYNDSELGHNNRTGIAGQLEAVFNDAGFKIATRYVTSDTIKENENQSKHSYVLLKFETLYDSLLK